MRGCLQVYRFLTSLFLSAAFRDVQLLLGRSCQMCRCQVGHIAQVSRDRQFRAGGLELFLVIREA